MIYKVKVYTNKKECSITCGEEYLEGLKKDVFDNEMQFIDLENIILPKSSIKKITIKSISGN